MALEAATYVDGLVASNPVGATDPKSQGDDHIRLVKAVLKASLPHLIGPWLIDNGDDLVVKLVPGEFDAGPSIEYEGVPLSLDVTGGFTEVLLLKQAGSGIASFQAKPTSGFGLSLRINFTPILSPGLVIEAGNGTPEGVVTAAKGSIFMRRDGTAAQTLYVKTTNTGNTGWVQK